MIRNAIEEKGNPASLDPQRGEALVCRAYCHFMLANIFCNAYDTHASQSLGVPYMEEVEGRELIKPAENYGVKMLSIGFFVNKNDAVLWRGAMASNALKQLIGDANWGELDYFLIDLPPGTSDIHLTMVQTLAITGAVVVSTPQEVALADARKGISMFTGDKVNVPV